MFAQKYLRRRQFRLHTAFIDATMISEIDAPVEFEVSIGHYGNKLDESLAPSVSTTQPTNAVFDGCHYYFLPWGDSKPCVTVDCQWEDVSFRLEAVNLLLTIVDKLVSSFLSYDYIAVELLLPYCYCYYYTMFLLNLFLVSTAIYDWFWIAGAGFYRHRMSFLQAYQQD